MTTSADDFDPDDARDPEPERLDLRSADVVAPRVRALAGLFPEAVRDGKLDMDVLLHAVGDVAEEGGERFGLSWPGKADAIRMAQRPSDGTLLPMPESSVDWGSTENLLVEGENLEVLKLLQRSYHGRAKLIYIDPPYNTGRDFVYPDNFRDPLGEYLKFSGQTSESGGRLRANAETSGRYHSSWLSMIWPRLHLARSLLANDGVLVCSIDDVEVPRLRMLLDEIFGEENFIASVIWQKVFSPKNSARHFSVDHDYLVVYARDAEVWRPRALPRTPEMEARYQNPDDDSRGPWTSGDLAARNYYSEGTYPVAGPSGRVIDGPPTGSYWRVSKTRFEELDGDGRIWWGADGGGVPRIKRFLSEVQDGRVPQTLWTYKEVGHTQDAKKQLLKLVTFESSESVFDTPKPVGLMRRLLELTTEPAEPALVVDFFAGSGTIGEAVLRANAEDGGNRRFILVQLGEPLDDQSHRSIADVTQARLAGVEQELSDRPSLGAERKGGYRVYRLDKTARSGPEPIEAGDQTVFDPSPAIDPSRDDEALLTEVLLARGFDLVTPTTWSQVAGLRVASVADGALVATFTRTLSVEQFEALVALDPAQLILLEAAFGAKDEVKVNSLQYLSTVNAHRDTPMELLLL